MNETSHTEWIEQYLLGELEGDSLRAFQKRMQQQEFQQEVALQEQIMRHIQYAGEEELRQKLNRFHDALPAETPRPVAAQRIPWNYIYVSLAASLLLLLGVFWLYRDRLVPEPPALSPQLAFVSVHRQPQPSDRTAEVADTLQRMAVLLYPDTLTHYFFDDTLRLYGNWDTRRMYLWYDTLRIQYVLQLDTFRYELQRYVDVRIKP